MLEQIGTLGDLVVIVVEQVEVREHLVVLRQPTPDLFQPLLMMTDILIDGFYCGGKAALALNGDVQAMNDLVNDAQQQQQRTTGDDPKDQELARERGLAHRAQKMGSIFSTLWRVTAVESRMTSFLSSLPPRSNFTAASAPALPKVG